MRHHNSLMHDVLKPMPWRVFDKLVDEHGADRCVRRLSTRSQFIALVHGQLSGAQSLRDIVSRMASQETRLYHLGRRQGTEAVDAVGCQHVAAGGHLCRGVRHRSGAGPSRTEGATKQAIRLIDATSLRLSSLSKDWAAYEAHALC